VTPYFGGKVMRCDAKTFAQMYEQIYTDLYRFALCLMKDSHEAEDVVSEAVISAYENIHRLRKKEAFKSWIFTILSNICKKRLKKASRENTYLENMNSEKEIYEKTRMEESDYGLALDVRNAFFILSEEEQLIVGLSVFGGYNSSEIADMLKLNANTVRSKRSRALSKMECILK